MKPTHDQTLPLSVSESANDDDYNPLGIRSIDLLPPGMPELWNRGPIQISVGLILTGHNGVYRSFFDDFAATSLQGALLNIARHEDVYLVYTFSWDGALPAYRFDADWPLMRRGRNAPTPRCPVQRITPWDWQSDPTLFEIRNEPIGFWHSRCFLRVGGRSVEDAQSNWRTCAQVLRPLLRKARLQVKSK